ncbi:MFS transporter [Pseudoalteromonas sp. GB56]
MFSSTSSAAPHKASVGNFDSRFYIANLMEVFERLAWYGFFAVSSIYMTTPKSQGGIEFSEIERGAVQGIIPFFLYLLPVLTGAMGDKLGYRRMFIFSFSIMAPGYFLLGQADSFWAFFGALSLVALGAACFKPVVVGTISHCTNDHNRGLGFGIFYTMVNVGGFIGPMVAGAMRAISWDAVFMMSAGWILINFIPALFYYRDPPSLNTQKSSLKEVVTQAQQVLGNARLALLLAVAIALLMSAGVQWLSYERAFVLMAAWAVANYAWNKVAGGEHKQLPWWQQKIKVSNPRFALYLLILTGFWTVYNQLFYTLPLYIRDYVDTRDLLSLIGLFGEGAVDFFAHVDMSQIKGNVQSLFSQLHQGAHINIESLRLQWVHDKINVPTSEMTVLVNELSAISGFQAELTIEQVNTFAQRLTTFRQINPEYLINLDFAAIVLAQIALSALCQRFKTFYVLSAGLVVMVVAFVVLMNAGMYTSGILVVTVILLIALAEMLTSPKSQEYVASIADKSQAALYMGYYFVSMALGFLFAGFLSGWSYAHLTLEMHHPALMWGVFAAIALVTAIGLFWFHHTQAQK